MTIKDIAEISGYGLGTVSRVINNKSGVSDKAREEILRVIKESNYEPNSNARLLKMRDGSVIGVIVKGNHNFLFADIIEKVQSAFSDVKENVITEYIDEDGDEVEHALRMIRDKNLKGILFLGANIGFFDGRMNQVDIPCVILTTNAQSLKVGKISSVSVNDEEAACEMISYLINKGHVNIGVIGGTLSENQISFSRYKGCEKGFRENQIPFRPKTNYVPCRYSMDAGYEATKVLLDKNPNITAIFALSDIMAFGAIRAVNDMGIRVPEDISIAGFDGISISEYCIPRLTTIRQDTATIASRGVNLLLKNIHYECESEHYRAPFSLIEAESVIDLNR